MLGAGCGCRAAHSLPSPQSGCVPLVWDSIWTHMETMSGNNYITIIAFEECNPNFMLVALCLSCRKI